jgi:hypothetical protein
MIRACPGHARLRLVHSPPADKETRAAGNPLSF